MADIRYQALNAAGINVAEINGKTVDSKTGGEVAIGAGFILGISTGVVQIAIKATSVVPVIGHSVDMFALHLSQEEFPVGFAHNGKTYVFPAKCTEYSKTGGEVAIGAGFILGISTGVVQIAIKATSVVPVIGHSVDMFALHLAQEEFPVGFAHNGKTYVFPAKCTEYSNKDEAKTGMSTADITITQAGPAVSI